MLKQHVFLFLKQLYALDTIQLPYVIQYAQFGSRFFCVVLYLLINLAVHACSGHLFVCKTKFCLIKIVNAIENICVIYTFGGTFFQIGNFNKIELIFAEFHTIYGSDTSVIFDWRMHNRMTKKLRYHNTLTFFLKARIFKFSSQKAFCKSYKKNTKNFLQMEQKCV